MRKLIRQHPRFFLAVLIAAVLLRLIFIFRFPGITTDSFIYGDIAKNWLQNGTYAVSSPQGPVATWIRLPGYPAFLAAVFSIFGMEHYRAVLFLQLLIDLGTCLLISDLTRRLVSPRAAKIAFVFSGLCPFLADYVAAALTETLEIFFTVLALDLAVVALDSQNDIKPGFAGLRAWLGCGAAIGAAILLRPDGGLLLVALGMFLAGLVMVRMRQRRSYRRLICGGLTILVVALLPLIPWTLRNLRTLHRFEPLAPRYANEEDEFVPMGFNRWIKTWIVDYASVEEAYWPVPGNTVDVEQLPNRAFDSPEQRDETEQLLADYNNALHVTPDLDRRFNSLAQDRIRHSPIRYYVWLPIARMADMWMRPRTEKLPSDTRWWEFDDDPKWLTLALALGAINLAYIGLGLGGLVHAKSIKYLGLLLTFVVLRTLFLGTLENPEPRYTLECYPVLILLASSWL